MVKKTIDFVIDSLRGGGAERVCVILANGLSRKGYSVRLVVLNLEDAVYRGIVDPKVQIVCLKKIHTRDALFAIASYLRVKKPETVVAFTPELSLIFVFLRKILKLDFRLIARCINTLSSLRKSTSKSLWRDYVVPGLIKKLYKEVDYLIAQSQGMADDLVRNYGVNKKRLSVINNPVDSRNMVRITYVESIKKAQKDRIILFVGRLDYQKGLEYLFNAFFLVEKQEKNVILKLVGKGNLEIYLRRLAKKMGIADKVIFAGFSNDIISEYVKAKITVLSSLYEGFPNVLIESIATGTPVVAFDCPSGPSDIIIDDMNGYLVPYKNEQALAVGIVKALNKKWNYASVQKTSERFSLDSILNKYIKVFFE